MTSFVAGAESLWSNSRPEESVRVRVEGWRDGELNIDLLYESVKRGRILQGGCRSHFLGREILRVLCDDSSPVS